MFSISPLDGRYDLSELAPYVSEYALIQRRLQVEIRYLLFLDKYNIVKFSEKQLDSIYNIANSFDTFEAEAIKLIEKKTRHDVKAVEIYLRERLPEEIREYVHLGITSEDINNIAYRLMLREAVEAVIITKLYQIRHNLETAEDIPMLARTHGQPAAPTNWRHEMLVFKARLDKEALHLTDAIDGLTGKFNGAVGEMTALKFAYPDVDWLSLQEELIRSFNLRPNYVTTQINAPEDIIFLFQNLQRSNGILLDYVQDMWRYISDGWVTLRDVEGEYGSSTMPQKINPIDFENAEGNLVLANGLAQTMIDKLYVSRLQRDLSNSTIMRNIGTLLGYCVVAYNSILTGMERSAPNEVAMKLALQPDWKIYAETLQVYLRAKGVTDAYDLVKKLTRNS